MDQRRAGCGAWTCSAGSPTATTCPGCSARREREVGIVLHADTLFGDGPGKDAPGELRGLGAPAPIDPHSAAELARTEIEAGAATRVLLVDGDGVLQRTLRLPKAPPGGWTRDLTHRPSPQRPARTCRTCRPSPTNRPWRSPTTSAPSTPAAPPMTAPGSRPAATSTTTSPGPADPPASRICVHAAGATTSSRPEASCKHACTPTDPSPPQPCSARPSPPDPNPCPATVPARPTPPRTQPDAGANHSLHSSTSRFVEAGCSLPSRPKPAQVRPWLVAKAAISHGPVSTPGAALAGSCTGDL